MDASSHLSLGPSLQSHIDGVEFHTLPIEMQTPDDVMQYGHLGREDNVLGSHRLSTDIDLQLERVVAVQAGVSDKCGLPQFQRQVLADGVVGMQADASVDGRQIGDDPGEMDAHILNDGLAATEGNPLAVAGQLEVERCPATGGEPFEKRQVVWQLGQILCLPVDVQVVRVLLLRAQVARKANLQSRK